MKHLAAYLLLQLGGNASPSAEDIKKVLDSVGIEADDERLSKVVSELEGKNVAELITEGQSKLASVPSGGAVAAAPSAAAAGGAAAPAEEKKEEKKEEEKEESDDGEYPHDSRMTKFFVSNGTLTSVVSSHFISQTWVSVSSTKRIDWSKRAKGSNPLLCYLLLVVFPLLCPCITTQLSSAPSASALLSASSHVQIRHLLRLVPHQAFA